MNLTTKLSILSLAAAAAIATGCGHRSTDRSVASIAASDSLPASVKELVQAVDRGDSAAFARMVSYPLLRPYPLKDIEDEAQMRAYYSTLMDDSLRAVITGSEPEEWREYGWRGWSVGDGRYVWLDEGVYDVIYISRSEREAMQQLVDRELASLAPQLRKGWRPVGCLKSAGGPAVMRLDVNTSGRAPVYRLCVYRDRAAMRSLPMAMLTGYKETEGSASITTYHFTAPDGSTATYLADIPDGSDPTVEFISAAGPDSTVTVLPAYWLDLLP